MEKSRAEQLKSLPSVGVLLQSAEISALASTHGRGTALFAVRCALESVRRLLVSGAVHEAPNVAELMTRAAEIISQLKDPATRRVVNATGIIVHTGLGRSPLGDHATDALGSLNRYAWLEVERESGDRGKREDFTEQLLCELTGCEAAVVVNNNAAAIFLALRALAKGKEVVVSRGQQIEIGGSFRLPDVMIESGVLLKEIGTTNKTRIEDFESALSDKTGALLCVHPSNYRIHGFTSFPALAEVCALGKKAGVPVIEDLGSGAMHSIEPYGLPAEPTIGESIRAGVDVVCFSGDKLLGGPQAGILAGKKAAIEKIRKHPLFRMLRPDKILLTALDATLTEFLDWPASAKHLPFYELLSKTAAGLDETARKICSRLSPPAGIRAEVCEDKSFVGGGALPDQSLPSSVIKIKCEDAARADVWARDAVAQLRMRTPAVLARVGDQALLLDVRCLLGGDEEILVEAIAGIFKDAA